MKITPPSSRTFSMMLRKHNLDEHQVISFVEEGLDHTQVAVFLAW